MPDPKENQPKPTPAPSGAPELDSDTLAGSPDVAAPTDRIEADGDAMSDDSEKVNQSDATDDGASATGGDEFDSLEHGLDDIPDAGPRQRPSRVKRFFAGYWRRKKWTLPLTVLAIIGVLAAVPWSRYFILGQFMSQTFQVQLVDAKTGKPVSGAKLTLADSSATTDSKGNASLKAKVGSRKLSIEKKYYSTHDASVFVGIAKQKSAQKFELTATGRQVPLSVVNKLTGKPLEEATLKAAGTEVKTDKQGRVLMVLPADQNVLNITVSVQGYNTLQTTVEVTEQSVKRNNYALTPNGQVYFLSKLSGKIDVVKTNLDGSNRQTVLGGTGREEDANTQLLASRDWKYLALYSKRGSEVAKLYLINTDTDKMTTIDGSSASFSLVGWSDHNFVYQMTRNDVKTTEPNRTAIKSYNAENGQTLTIDQNQVSDAAGTVISQQFVNVFGIGGQVVYTVTWNGYGETLAGKSTVVRVASAKTGVKKDLKTFAATDYSYFNGFPYEPREVYLTGYSITENKSNTFEVDFNGETPSIKQISIDPNKVAQDYYSGNYATYLTSPSSSKTLWSESRDGRNVFFVGDADGDNGKELATLEEYSAYGWYTDDYVLLSKKGSELYIRSVETGQMLKISDYHKPNIVLRGYGGGYGGL